LVASLWAGRGSLSEVAPKESDYGKIQIGKIFRPGKLAGWH
jgi:hypothetical protein